jgi:hypothetical protein
MQIGDETVVYMHTSGKDSFLVPDQLSRFKTIVLIEQIVAASWRWQAAGELVSKGCAFMMAWGFDATLWDDDVDVANLERFAFQIPDDCHVMTTWHSDDTLEEIFNFSKNRARFDMNDTPINECLILHIAPAPRSKEIVDLYRIA